MVKKVNIDYFISSHRHIPVQLIKDLWDLSTFQEWEDFAKKNVPAYERLRKKGNSKEEVFECVRKMVQPCEICSYTYLNYLDKFNIAFNEQLRQRGFEKIYRTRICDFDVLKFVS